MYRFNNTVRVIAILNCILAVMFTETASATIFRECKVTWSSMIPLEGIFVYLKDSSKLIQFDVNSLSTKSVLDYDESNRAMASGSIFDIFSSSSMINLRSFENDKVLNMEGLGETFFNEGLFIDEMITYFPRAIDPALRSIVVEENNYNLYGVSRLKVYSSPRHKLHWLPLENTIDTNNAIFSYELEGEDWVLDRKIATVLVEDNGYLLFTKGIAGELIGGPKTLNIFNTTKMEKLHSLEVKGRLQNAAFNSIEQNDALYITVSYWNSGESNYNFLLLNLQDDIVSDVLEINSTKIDDVLKDKFYVATTHIGVIFWDLYDSNVFFSKFEKNKANKNTVINTTEPVHLYESDVGLFNIDISPCGDYLALFDFNNNLVVLGIEEDGANVIHKENFDDYIED